MSISLYGQSPEFNEETWLPESDCVAVMGNVPRAIFLEIATALLRYTILLAQAFVGSRLLPENIV